jgi:hypothetical protein
MVERVARAIFEEMVRQERVPDEQQPTLGENKLTLARAAIAAMREPTEAMFDALSNTNVMWEDNNSRGVWTAMCDGALNDAALEPDADR